MLGRIGSWPGSPWARKTKRDTKGPCTKCDCPRSRHRNGRGMCLNHFVQMTNPISHRLCWCRRYSSKPESANRLSKRELRG